MSSSPPLSPGAALQLKRMYAMRCTVVKSPIPLRRVMKNKDNKENLAVNHNIRKSRQDEEKLTAIDVVNDVVEDSEMMSSGGVGRGGARMSKGRKGRQSPSALMNAVALMNGYNTVGMSTSRASPFEVLSMR